MSGHPLEALVWLANSEAAAAMGGLPAGWIVSLGSVWRTHWLGRRDGPSQASASAVRVGFARGAAPDPLDLTFS